MPKLLASFATELTSGLFLKLNASSPFVPRKIRSIVTFAERKATIPEDCDFSDSQLNARLNQMNRDWVRECLRNGVRMQANELSIRGRQQFHDVEDGNLVVGKIGLDLDQASDVARCHAVRLGSCIADSLCFHAA